MAVARKLQQHVGPLYKLEVRACAKAPRNSIGFSATGARPLIDCAFCIHLQYRDSSLERGWIV
jgi:hypothetical protein